MSVHPLRVVTDEGAHLEIRPPLPEHTDPVLRIAPQLRRSALRLMKYTIRFTGSTVIPEVPITLIPASIFCGVWVARCSGVSVSWTIFPVLISTRYSSFRPERFDAST